jgi:hypothetical protein
LTQGANANTQAAASISDLYKSAYDNAPDAGLWAKLATEASSTPKGKVTNSSSRGLSDMTDTMSNTTPSSGVTTPASSVMVTGTPTGSTWGSTPTPVADTSPATPVNWDTALTPEDTGSSDTTADTGMSFDQWAGTTSGDTGATGQMADDMLGRLGLGDMSANDLLGAETPTDPEQGQDSMELTSIPKAGDVIDGLTVHHTDFMYLTDDGRLTNNPTKNIAGTRIYYNRGAKGEGISISASGYPMRFYKGLK